MLRQLVLAGVHFMAETAKLLNPEKKVLIPDPAAGRSLADLDTAAGCGADDAPALPGAPVVAYVNTSTAVKAESDIPLHSGNALAIVEALGAERVIMLPDEYLAQNIATDQRGRSSPGKAIAKSTSLHRCRRSADLAKITPGHRSRASGVRLPEVVAKRTFRIDRGDVGLRGKAAAAPAWC